MTLARKICLDLGSVRPVGRKFIDAVINERFDTFDFETALCYVALPPRKGSHTTEDKIAESDFLDTYKVVFDFLRDKKVKKIFKVTVNDLVGRPHNDDVIITLAREFGVEQWDWKKLDISSETILDAAPLVRRVFLHSSGSFSALQGWACKQSLAKLTHVS